MRRGAKRWNDKIVGRLCQTPRRFAFVLSAEGAVFIVSLEQRPRIGRQTNISAEGAIHFPPFQLIMPTDLIRAFSASPLGILIPEAMPQTDNAIAPLALNAHRFTEPSRGDASETDGQAEGRVSGRRTSQTLCINCGVAIASSSLFGLRRVYGNAKREDNSMFTRLRHSSL
jgi:hypothetical protein